MTPDDPRHGTEAGRSQHQRDGEEGCAACRRAKGRADKRRRVLGATLTPLPPQLWAIVRDNDLPLVARTTGLSECALKNMRKRNGDVRVTAETLARLTAFHPVSDVGIRRRLRALARLGWTARTLEPMLGIHHSAILVLQRPGHRRYITEHVRRAVVDGYADLSMKVAPPSRWSTVARARAETAGWLPPLAWNNIDDADESPATKPTSRPKTDVDPVVILRVIAGDRLPMTRAERVAVVTQMSAAGWSQERIEQQTGITRVDRLIQREAS